ncbi:uncharacterized protein LOC8030382 [Ixodes scapularis]|uniref:Uncharacterized protein n=1 Tax=Ixodes scapularis TaxID=6945 RepID=B7PRQ2_IXOSC|nr:uncharacterized protein LOC8030382 [Ixodes scapularis]EEC09274.1 hypothetical protein IscW_ISCW007351 [Ixodes scapularis]|eukprot:XP_002400729.1 hypothetical protein IscW_ISCW007351 [Ixodes scapularis]
MFRVLEGPDGVTRIYRASTNELVCCVKENANGGRAVLAPKSHNVSPSNPQHRRRAGSVGSPCSRGTPTKPHVGRPDTCCPVPRTKASFLRQLELEPVLPAPRAVLERLPATCDKGAWEGAQASVERYSKYCATRGRLAGPMPGPFPVIHRYQRHQKNLSHVYTFSRAQRLARGRSLATGLSVRTLALLDRCKRATVDVPRLTPAEVALWTKGRLRLNRTPLRELPGFMRPLTCLLLNLGPNNGARKLPCRLKYDTPDRKGPVLRSPAKLSLY